VLPDGIRVGAEGMSVGPRGGVDDGSFVEDDLGPLVLGPFGGKELGSLEDPLGRLVAEGPFPCGGRGVLGSLVDSLGRAGGRVARVGSLVDGPLSLGRFVLDRVGKGVGSKVDDEPGGKVGGKTTTCLPPEVSSLPKGSCINFEVGLSVFAAGGEPLALLAFCFWGKVG
jgi:hypothetical protein